MPSSRLWRAITLLHGLCEAALDEYVYPDDPLAAVLEDTLANELGIVGWIEPTIFWLAGLLQSLVDRAVAVSRLRFHPGFTRTELLWPGHSPAVHILRERKDSGYMLLMRTDVALFEFLVRKVAQTSPEWTDHRNNDRRYNLNAALVIAATLAWLGSNCTQAWLQQTFGNTRSPMSRDLKQGRRVLLKALRATPEAEIRWPTPAEMPWLFHLICQARDSMPSISECKVFGWLDGFRSRVLQPGVAAEQAQTYNGWVGDTSVLSLFGFLPTGKIFYASINHPGRMNDKSVSGDFMHKLLDPTWTARSYGILADAAFVSPRLLFKVWTRKRPANWPRGFVDETQWAAMTAWMTASRQAVEWGMRALRSRWARITAPMPNNAEERADLLELVALMHNLVSERMGANQIRSVYLEAALRHSDGFTRPEVVAADFF